MTETTHRHPELERRLDNQAQVLDRMDRRLDRIETRLNRLEDELEGSRVVVLEIRDLLNDILPDVVQRLTRIEEQIRKPGQNGSP